MNSIRNNISNTIDNGKANSISNGNKKISIILLGCVVIVIISYILYFLYTKFTSVELFGVSDSNSKRNKMMKIYKSNDISDPDENIDDDIMDPDSTNGRDPDS